MFERFSSRLFQPVDALPLNIFRVLFAITLIFQFFGYVSMHFIEAGILAPKFLFAYDYLPFIKPFPSGGMKFILYCTFIGPVLMLFKKTLRVGVVLFLISFAYLFFLEEAYFNNHFYMFLMLTSFWLFYKPQFDESGTEVIPYWQLFLFQFLVFLVYFYGGLAKINYDWLFLQQPPRFFIDANTSSALLHGDAAVYYIAYGGIIFDLVIGFLLWNRRTFLLAAIGTIIFNISNHYIFNMGEGGSIGVFPLAMTFANFLFIDTVWLRRFLARWGLDNLGRKSSEMKKAGTQSEFFPIHALTRNLVILFVVVQLLLPFRYLLVSKDVAWTGQASFFSWRMKILTKEVKVKFYARRKLEDVPEEVNIGRIINTMQISYMAQNADMIYKFSQYLKKDFRKKWGVDPIITADIKVGLNGRPMQAFVDTNTNLAQVNYSTWERPDWVLEMKE